MVGDKDAARKSVAAGSAVSGDHQILHTIVSAARNGNVDVGSVNDELNISGKDAESAGNPI